MVKITEIELGPDDPMFSEGVTMSSHKKPTSNKDNIREKAQNKADSQIYSMNNPYLNIEEKYEVELWFQSPGDILWLTFFLTVIGIYQLNIDLSLLQAAIYAWFLGAFVALLNWWIYPTLKPLWNVFYSLFINKLIQLLGLLIGVWLIYQGEYLWGVVSLLSVVGLMAIFEPQTIIYTVLATRKYKMHPKYAFFKRFYSKNFSFE